MDVSRVRISNPNRVWSRAMVGIVGSHALGDHRLQCRRAVRVDDDEVGLLADIEIAETVLHIERAGAAERSEEQQLGGMHGDRLFARFGDVHLEGVIEYLRNRPFVSATEIRSGGDVYTGSDGSQPWHGARAEELLRDRGSARWTCPSPTSGMSSTSWQCTAVRHDGAPPEHARPPTFEPGRNLPS